MKIALAQLNPTIGDIKGNVAKIIAAIHCSQEEGVNLLLCPELAVTGYPPRDLLLYRAFLREVERVTLQQILPATSGLAVILGVPWGDEEQSGRLYNSALVLKDGEIISLHHKSLLPNYDVFDEHRYFTPAPRRSLLSLEGQQIAVAICEDTWNDKDYWERRLYPEDPVEEMFGLGAEILVNLSASPYHLGKVTVRESMLSALAGKYNAPLYFVNQVGGNDELIFDGSSMICSGDGNVVYQAPSFQEGLVFYQQGTKPGAETARFTSLEPGRENDGSRSRGVFNPGLSAAVQEQVKAVPGAFKNRVLLTTGLENAAWVYQALVLGIRDYLAKTGFERALIGLSGGIDSSVTAALAVSALGPEQVLGVLMPSRYSSRHSISDSFCLAENLGIETRLLPVEEPLQAFLNLLNGEENPVLDLAEENIQARIRGSILMFISNRERRMLLTTGNKSEVAVGYCTLYGDMSGGLAVLADVPKTMVYRLAEFMNYQAGLDIVPQSVIEKAPSAELRPDQKDLDSLPPYEILDRILHLYIEENLHVDEIAAQGFDYNTVKSLVRKVDRSEHKRYQSAPGLRVTTRAFGSGRRMPMAADFFTS